MVKVVRQYWQGIVFLPGDSYISKGLLDSSIPPNFGGIFARKINKSETLPTFRIILVQI